MLNLTGRILEQMVLNRLGAIACFAVVLILLFFVRGENARANGWELDERAVELSGFSTSEAYQVEEGRPLDLRDRYFQKLTYRTAKVSAANFDRWAQFTADVGWRELIDQPRSVRFHVFQRDVSLRRLQEIPLATTTGDPKRLFLADCIAGDGQRLMVVVNSKPAAIPIDSAVDQPIRFAGFFYNTVAVDASGDVEIQSGSLSDSAFAKTDFSPAPTSQPAVDVVPLFVSNRFAWYPGESDAGGGVTPGQVQLAAAGVDIGLFDYVKRQNGRPLSTTDSDAFFQVLAAAGKFEEKLETGKHHIVPYAEMMKSPKSHFGNLIDVRGRLRQCVKIEVTNSDQRSVFGRDHYYQVNLFPGQSVSYPARDGRKIKFDRFPVWICLPELPVGMSPSDLEGRPARVTGHFYRFVKYQSEKSAQVELDGQLSPLLMAVALEVGAPGADGRQIALLMNLLLGLVVVAVGGMVVYFVIRDRNRSRRHRSHMQDLLPDQIETGDIEDQFS